MSGVGAANAAVLEIAAKAATKEYVTVVWRSTVGLRYMRRGLGVARPQIGYPTTWAVGCGQSLCTFNEGSTFYSHHRALTLAKMTPYWTSPDGTTAWYRVHILDKNYSVKVTESPFEEDVKIIEVKFEWSGGNTMPRHLHDGSEYERVCAAFWAAKKAA